MNVEIYFFIYILKLNIRPINCIVDIKIKKQSFIRYIKFLLKSRKIQFFNEKCFKRLNIVC